MPAATATEVEPPPAPPLDPGWFARRMDGLGPWVGGAVAVAVSGGADSLALAWMVRNWLRDGAPDRPEAMLALVVDHGLRAQSGAEARLTLDRLRDLGIDAQLLTLRELQAGPGIAARARTARYTALTACCHARGIVDLLVAHHAADQAETVAMRIAARSGMPGLAGMAMVAEQTGLRIVRPLLDCAPGALRATLRAAGVNWVEDPSNLNLRATRVQARFELRADPARSAELLDRAQHAGPLRTAATQDDAGWLAEHAYFDEGGAAFLACSPETMPADALAALVQAIGGAEWPPSEGAVCQFAARAAQGATLGGVRLLPARVGWWLVREAVSCAQPCPAISGAVWDNRFRFAPPVGWQPPDAGRVLTIAALGDSPVALRRGRGLPPLVRRAGLPALYANEALVCVPHLGWSAPGFEAVRFAAAWRQPVVRQPGFHASVR